MQTERPVEVAGQDFAEKPATVFPSGLGAHNWQPMSYSPRTGLVYIPAMNMGAPMSDEPVFRASSRVFSTGNESDGAIHNAQLVQTMLPEVMTGYLLAWDPREQKSVWEVDQGAMGNGGTLVTAGDLVFQGMIDGGFAAFDARDGTERFRFETQNGIMGSPISYAVDGEQYVAIAAARGGGLSAVLGRQYDRANTPTSGRLLVFRISGDAKLPMPMENLKIPQPPAIPDVDDEVLARGSRLYSELCARCHGTGVVASGGIPDLRHMSSGTHSRFEDIVFEGAYVSIGMPHFKEELGNPADLAAVHAYVIEQGHADDALRNGNPVWRAIKQAAYSTLAWILF
jgi:mono/diheme cytochrome c family protein